MSQKKYALVTGGTSGIGLELAKLFAKDGYHLVIVARNEEELHATSEEIKQQFAVEVLTISKDLFEVENTYDLYDEIKIKGIEIDVLVNNAGQGQYGEFAETDLKRELAIIQLNVSSLVVLTKLFLQDMLQRGEGKILNLSSTASRLPGAWQSVYHGTKAFVQSFTEAIRAENKDSGVSITALLPGATDTDFFHKADMTGSKVVQGKLADPAQVAKDGYEALMKGDDMVVSGMKNKMQAGIAALTPDAVLAGQMYDKQAPVNRTEKK